MKLVLVSTQSLFSVRPLILGSKIILMKASITGIGLLKRCLGKLSHFMVVLL